MDTNRFKFDDSAEYFRTPDNTTPKVSKLQKQKPALKKSRPRKKPTKINKLQRSVQTLFSNVDVNPDHLQLAIALSESEYDVQSKSTENDTPDRTKSLADCSFSRKSVTLEDFGFTTRQQAKNTTTNVKKKGGKKSRYCFVTPILKTRTEEERQQRISLKTSKILACNNSHCCETNPVPKTSLYSTILDNISNKTETYKCSSFRKDQLPPTIYYVPNLNVKPTNTTCGLLLQNWTEIPGRDLSPIRHKLNTFDHKQIDPIGPTEEDSNINNSNEQRSLKDLENSILITENEIHYCEQTDLIEVEKGALTTIQKCTESPLKREEGIALDSKMNDIKCTVIQNSEDGDNRNEVFIISDDESVSSSVDLFALHEEHKFNDFLEDMEQKYNCHEVPELETFDYKSTNTLKLNIEQFSKETSLIKTNERFSSRLSDCDRILNATETQLCNDSMDLVYEKYLTQNTDEIKTKFSNSKVNISMERASSFASNSESSQISNDDIIYCISDEEINYSTNGEMILKNLTTSKNFTSINDVDGHSSDSNPSRFNSENCTSQIFETPQSFNIKTTNVTPIGNYDRMSTPNIVEELGKFGVRPMKRKRAVKLLKYIYEATHPLISTEDSENDDDNVCDLNVSKKRRMCSIQGPISIVGDIVQDNNDELIFERKLSRKIHSCRIPLDIVWFNFLSANPELNVRILCFEPIRLETVYKMLKEQGFRFHIKDLLNFLDSKCISVNATTVHRKQ